MTFRVSRPDALKGLGLLQDLPGTWIGSGFNMIARPDQQDQITFLLIVNAIDEVLTFTPLGATIPNRGSKQGDIQLAGLQYVQQVTDSVLHSAIHFEPGLWLRVPKTAEPRAKETYVRHASIPHGNALVAQSVSFKEMDGGPTIEPVDSTPFVGETPALNASPNEPRPDRRFMAPFTTTPLPAGLPKGLKAAATIKNPALVLTEAIKKQRIRKTVQIHMSTEPSGGILNIPFLATNANAARLDAIFWIETVEHPNGKGQFLQLQYVQRVILDFQGMHWPHISVATLVKQ